MAEWKETGSKYENDIFTLVFSIISSNQSCCSYLIAHLQLNGWLVQYLKETILYPGHMLIISLWSSSQHCSSAYHYHVILFLFRSEQILSVFVFFTLLP